ncbi:MAG: 6-bladed beta-propeller [Desulfuromonadia bacterium]
MRRIGMMLLMTLLLSSCATAPPVPKERFFWPRLPERPRVEWLGAYSSETDLDPGGASSILASIVGSTEEIILQSPVDIAGIGRKKLYVVDPQLGNVVVFDFERKNVSYLVPFVEKNPLFKSPVAIAVDGDGNIYVSDNGEKKILVFDRSHKPIKAIPVQPHMLSAGGIFIDSPRKRIITTDPRGHRFCFFGLDGTFDRCVGERGDGDGQLNFPGAVTVNQKGEIIIADVMNARIQIFDGEGKFLWKFGRRGDGPGEFQIIKSVGVDSEGHFYISDGKAHTVSIFSDTGDYLLTVGGRFSAAASGKVGQGGFLIPQKIYFAPDDHFFVADQMNGRIQEFRYLSDQFIRQNPIPGYQEKGSSPPDKQ